MVNANLFGNSPIGKFAKQVIANAESQVTQLSALPATHSANMITELNALNAKVATTWAGMKDEEKADYTDESEFQDLQREAVISKYSRLNEAYQLQADIAAKVIVAPYTTYGQEIVDIVNRGATLAGTLDAVSTQINASQAKLSNPTANMDKPAWWGGLFAPITIPLAEAQSYTNLVNEVKKETSGLLDLSAVVAVEIRKNAVYQSLYTIMPAWVSQGTVLSIEDLFGMDSFKKTADALGITEDDPTINHLLDSLLGAVAQATDDTGTTVINNPDLSYDQLVDSLLQEKTAVPVSMNQLTDEEIRKYMAADYKEEFTVSTETSEQALDTLKTGGVDEELADDLTSLEELTSEYDDYWTMLEADTKNILAGIEQARMPNLGAWGNLKLFISAPVTVTLDALNNLNKYYFAPLAGYLYKHWGEALDSLPGVTAYEDTGFEEKYTEYTEEYGSWVGAGKAFDEAGVGWANRVLFNFVFEPSSYLGFGLYTKAGRGLSLVSKIPKIGKYLKPISILGKGIGTLEYGYTQFWDVAIFDRLKDFGKFTSKVATHVPLFGSVVAAPFRQLPYQIAEKVAGSDMIAVHKWLNIATHRFFWKVPVDEAVEVLKTARNYVLKHPEDLTSPQALAGRAILRVNELNEDLVAALVKRLGSTEKITRDLLIDVNQIIFRTSLYGGELFSIKEASALLLRRLAVHDTPELFKLAQKEIETAMRLGVKSSDEIFSSAAKTSDILLSVYRNSNATSFATLSSRAAHNLSMTGRLHAAASKLSWRAIEIQRNTIDRWLVTPMARSYLVFGSYGSFNVLEGFIKPFLATHKPVNPFWKFGRHNPILRTQKVTAGLNIPMTVASMVSTPEMASQLPTMLDMVKMSNALKMWRKITGGGVLAKWLVDLPGRIGAMQRANYFHKLFIRNLADDNPEVVSAMVKTIQAHLDALPDSFYKQLHMSKSDLLAELVDDAIGGVHNVRQVLTDIVSARLTKPGQSMDDVLSNQVATNMIQDIAEKHPEIHAPILNDLLNSASDSSLFENAGRAIKDKFDTYKLLSYDYVLHSPEVLKARVDDIAKKIINSNPQNKAEMLEKLSQIQELRGFISEGSHDVMRAAMEMKNTMAKKLSYTEWQEWSEKYLLNVYNKTIEFAESATKQFDDLMKNINDDIAKLASPSTGRVPRVVSVDFREGFSDVISAYRKQTTLLDDAIVHQKVNNGIDLLEELTTVKEPLWDNVIAKVEEFMQDVQYRTVPTSLTKADQNTLSRLVSLLESEKFASPIALAARDMIVSICHGDTAELSKIVKELEGMLRSDPRFAKYFSTATGIFTDSEARSAVATMDKWAKEVRYTQGFVSKLRTMQKDMMLNKPKKGEAEIRKFWSDFNGMTSSQWNIWRDEVAALKEGSAIASAEFSRVLRVAGKEPTVINAAGRSLSKADVAAIFNGQASNLAGSLIKTDTMMLKDKIHFAAEVHAQAERMAQRVSKTADQMGFTYDAIERVYDDCLRELHMSPQMSSVLEPMLQSLKELRGEIFHVYHSKGVAKGTAQALEDMAQALGDDLMKIKGYGTVSFNQARQRAADKASKEYYKDWADYDNNNAMTAFMRNFFPFYTYESHRLFWLPRTMLRKPVVFHAWGEYMNNTDNGYIHIPGTSLEINPLRGTIFMGGMTKLMKYDYKNYYDRFSGLTDIFDGLSRYGFYPAAWMQLLKITGGATSGGQIAWGEIIPSWVKSPLNMLIAIDPDNKVAQTILDTILAEPYRNYTTVMLAAKICQDEQKDFTGEEIYEHIQAGETLSAAEQDVWNRALRSNGLYQIALEQSGMMRLKTDTKIEVQEQLYRLYEQFTGYTKEQQQWLYKHGYQLSDYAVLDPLQQAVIQELDGIKYNADIYTALMPSSWQAEEIVRNEFWRSVDDMRAMLDSNTVITTASGQTIVGQEALDAAWQAGTINGKDWSEGRAALNIAFANSFALLAESDRYKNVPITLQDTTNADGSVRQGIISAMATQGETPTTQHPARELLNLYYSIKPQQTYNTETDTMETDWDRYYLSIATILDTLSADHQTEFIEMITKNMTPIEQVRFQVSKDYFQAYNSRYRAVMTQFSTEEQSLITEYYTASPDRRAAIREMLRPNSDLKIISQYNTMLRTMGENLRELSPALDAWLRVFGKTSETLTTEADALYTQYCSELGVPE